MYDFAQIGTAGVWRILPTGGYARLLHFDPATGAITLSARFDPGTSIPPHWHTYADELLFVLEGEIVQQGQTLGPGSILFAQAGSVHGPLNTPSGCTALLHYSADLDFHLASPEHDVPSTLEETADHLLELFGPDDEIDAAAY